jgi:hypothetical protein
VILNKKKLFPPFYLVGPMPRVVEDFDGTIPEKRRLGIDLCGSLLQRKETAEM